MWYNEYRNKERGTQGSTKVKKMNQKFLLKWTEKGPIVIETKSNIISYETIKNHVADLVDYVSYIDFGNTKYEIIVDDEGICKKLPITFIVVDKVNLKICSPLAGPCLIVKSDSEIGRASCRERV